MKLAADSRETTHRKLMADGRFVTLLVSMKLRLLGLTVGLVTIAALAGCGTPGAPSLPSLNLSVPVDDLTASRRGNNEHPPCPTTTDLVSTDCRRARNGLARGSDAAGLAETLD